MKQRCQLTHDCVICTIPGRKYYCVHESDEETEAPRGAEGGLPGAGVEGEGDPGVQAFCFARLPGTHERADSPGPCQGTPGHSLPRKWIHGRTAWPLAPVPAGKQWARPFLLGTDCLEISFKEAGKACLSRPPPGWTKDSVTEPPCAGTKRAETDHPGFSRDPSLDQEVRAWALGLDMWRSGTSPWLHAATCMSQPP